MSSKVDTIMWSLLKAGGYWNEENLPMKIYLAGALFTGYMYWCFACPHCFGMADKASFFGSLLANVALWPISVAKYFATGTPIIIRTRADNERMKRSRGETLRTLALIGGEDSCALFSEVMARTPEAPTETTDKNAPSS